MKCRDKLTEEDQNLFFKIYWGLGDQTRNWGFLARNIKMFKKKCNTVNQSE